MFRFPLADYPVKGTQDKSYKTGVSVKLQAFRYVGRGNAAVMHALDLCLEEYLDYLMEHPHLAVFENGQLRYEIVREYVGEGDPFQVHVSQKSGIKNDPNDWSREHKKPKYILDLLLSVINLSCQTVDIVKSLPKLKF